MYLSKNSGSVFRKSQWFSSNIFKRKLKVSLFNSGGRVPEDDPTKPPLRLNIPKDATVPNPYQFNSEISLAGCAKPKINKEKMTPSWLDTSMSQGESIQQRKIFLDFNEDYELIDSEDRDHDARRTHSNCELVAGDVSPDVSDSQNFLVKSKSSESLIKKRNSDEKLNRVRKTEKKFTLKKEHISDIMKFQDAKLSKESEMQDKSGIMSIKIALDDSVSDEIVHSKGSDDAKKEDVNSDEHIRALAEAIIKEITPNPSNSIDKQVETNRQDDEAFLVIINVMDRGTGEDAPSPEGGSADKGEPDSSPVKPSAKAAAEAKRFAAADAVDLTSSLKLAEDDFCENRIQVRDLDFCCKMGNDLCKRRDIPKSEAKDIFKWKSDGRCSRRVGCRPMSFSKNARESGKINTFSKLCELDLNEQARELQEMLQCRQSKKTRTGILRNERRYWAFSDGVASYKDNEIVMRGNADKDHKAKTVSNYFPLRKKVTPVVNLLKKKSLSKNARFIRRRNSFAGKKDTDQRYLDGELTRPIEYATDREMRMRTKIMPANYFEKEIGPLIAAEPKECSPRDILGENFLKPLSKQITFVDEIPEYLKYPEYKYAVLSNSRGKSKSLSCDKSKIKPATIRGHHYYSRRGYSKVTEDFGEGKLSLIILDNMTKSDTGEKLENYKADLHRIGDESGVRERSGDPREEGPRRIVLTNGQSIRKRESQSFSKSNLDSHLLKTDELSCKMSDLKGSNDIYLQEGNDMVSVVSPMEMKTVENVNAGSHTLSPIMQTYTSTDGATIHEQPLREKGSPSVEDKSIHSPIGFSEERYEFDIADVSSMSAGGSVPRGTRLPYSVAYPPNISADIDERKNSTEVRRLRVLTDKADALRHMSSEHFELNDKCLNERRGRSDETMSAGSDATASIGDFLLNSKKDNIMNVTKNTEDANTPRLSDNIVNIANESLAEDRGTTSVDSLSMMKRVKEIVDLDLKNAERIFVPFEEEVTRTTPIVSSCSDDICDAADGKRATLDDSGASHLHNGEAEPQVKSTEPDKDVKIFDPSQLKSVVVYDEAIGKFRVENEELELAVNHQSRELKSMILRGQDNVNIDQSLLKIVDINRDEFKGDFAVYVDAPNDATGPKYVLKSGDSIIVYDEQTRTWKVDYTLLKERQENAGYQNENATPIYDLLIDNPATGKVDQGEPFFTETTTSTILPNYDVVDTDPKSPHAQTETVEKTDSPAVKKEKEESPGKVKKTSDGSLKKRGKKEFAKEVDAQEIRRKNSDLYDDVFIEIKKPDPKEKKEDSCGKGGEVKGSEAGFPSGRDTSKSGKKADGAEKGHAEHYVSDNIVKMSKSSGIDKGTRLRTNKVETVKLNITPTTRPPSVVTEINLNKKCDDGKDSGTIKKDVTDSGSSKENGTDDQNQSDGNKTFYKKFEKYKTPFSDPEYEEKPMKINSDLESNPNLKKLDSWNKTLVLQEISKPPESIDSWIKDETDKMATLLLKVLQEAADGNNRKRSASKSPARGNPYEAIRKNQENNSGLLKAKVSGNKKRELGKKKGSDGYAGKSAKNQKVSDSLKRGAAGKKTHEKLQKGKGRFPVVEDEIQAEVIPPESYLPRESGREVDHSTVAAANGNITDDIPGPNILKKLSAFWKCLPDLGCQATVFSMMWLYQTGKMASSILNQVSKFRSNAFRSYFTKYGPVVKLQGPLSGDIVLINRPEDVAMVFFQGQRLPSRSVLDSVEKCRNRVRQKNLLTGINNSCNGTDWDVVRMSTVDVAKKGCLQYFKLISNADDMFVDGIRSRRNKQDQVPDDFMDDVKKWSLEGLCSILFDKSLGFFDMKKSNVHFITESDRLMRHLGEATDHLCQCESNFQMWRFVNTSAMMGLNQAYQSLDLIMSKYVYQAEITLRKKRKAVTNHRRNESVCLNFVESLLLNDRMTPEDTTANLIDILLIGANTTSVALGFLLYNLAQNCRVQRRLFNEIKELLPNKDSQLNYHQLHSIKYLQACLKESLRLNIPMPLLLRVLPSDVALANYRVPNGTHLVMDTHTACMKEQHFEDPDKFKPERWVDQDCIHPFASIPFCHGPRSDFIKRFAEIQLWTCVAKIVRNYKIEYHFGEINGTGNVISYPDKPLRLTFIERDE